MLTQSNHCLFNSAHVCNNNRTKSLNIQAQEENHSLILLLFHPATAELFLRHFQDIFCQGFKLLFLDLNKDINIKINSVLDTVDVLKFH